jgi:hypothetical protein
VDKRAEKTAQTVEYRVAKFDSYQPKRRRDIIELSRTKPLREPMMGEPVRGRNVYQQHGVSPEEQLGT